MLVLVFFRRFWNLKLDFCLDWKVFLLQSRRVILNTSFTWPHLKKQSYTVNWHWFISGRLREVLKIQKSRDFKTMTTVKHTWKSFVATASQCCADIRIYVLILCKGNIFTSMNLIFLYTQFISWLTGSGVSGVRKREVLDVVQVLLSSS